MRVGERLQEACEEFILNISRHERSENDDLGVAIADLRETVASDEGLYEPNLSVEKLTETRERSQEVYDLLSEEERCHNPILESSYEELFSTLDEIEYEALDAESFDKPACVCGEVFCDCEDDVESVLAWDEEE